MSNKYCIPTKIKIAAVIGTGTVGASWISLFLAHGFSINAYDPAPGAEAKTRSFIENAWPSLIELKITNLPKPPLNKLRFFESPAKASKGADFIQENTPETPEVKDETLKAVSNATDATVPIISSTGGIPPSRLQSVCNYPERVVVVHPFNPTHLMPLVEIIGGKQTSTEAIEWAVSLAHYLGKRPIKLNAELTGHLTNRLQFALVREAVSCFLDGTASAQDIDDAIRYGLGARWAFMGSFMSIHLAGGDGGTKAILAHAAPAIETWWTPGPQPKLTQEVIDRLAQAGTEVTKGQPIKDWTQWRDHQLLEVLKLQQASAAAEPSDHITTP